MTIFALGQEKVYIDDDDGMIYDATLNQADINKNANKVHAVNLTDDMIDC